MFSPYEVSLIKASKLLLDMFYSFSVCMRSDNGFVLNEIHTFNIKNNAYLSGGAFASILTNMDTYSKDIIPKDIDVWYTKNISKQLEEASYFGNLNRYLKDAQETDKTSSGGGQFLDVYVDDRLRCVTKNAATFLFDDEYHNENAAKMVLYTLENVRKSKIFEDRVHYLLVDYLQSILDLSKNECIIPPLQMIYSRYGEPLKVTSTFDFVHVSPYLDITTKLMFVSRNQFDCIINKKLMINENWEGDTPERTNSRIQKYLSRGYTYGKNFKEDVEKNILYA